MAATEVSFMAGGLFSQKDGTVISRKFTSEEREDIRAMMRELAKIAPQLARAMIEQRIVLANHAVAASLSSEGGNNSFTVAGQKDDVLEGLPYLEKIDDLVDEQTMELLDAAAGGGVH